jgi:hypothetical protein
LLEQAQNRPLAGSARAQKLYVLAKHAGQVGVIDGAVDQAPDLSEEVGAPHGSASDHERVTSTFARAGANVIGRVEVAIRDDGDPNGSPRLTDRSPVHGWPILLDSRPSVDREPSGAAGLCGQRQIDDLGASVPTESDLRGHRNPIGNRGAHRGHDALE